MSVLFWVRAVATSACVGAFGFAHLLLAGCFCFIMPRPVYESAAAELADLSRKQASVGVKHAKKNLLAVLAKNPHLWEKLDQQVTATGYTAEGPPFL